MDISVNFGFFERHIPARDLARMIAEAGLTCLDYTPCVWRDDWREDMDEHMAIFKEYGLSVWQTHCVFNRYDTYPKEHFAEYAARSLDSTIAMGARYMVAHGDEFDYEAAPYSEDAVLAYNHDFFAPLVQKAKENGVRVAFENVFEDRPGRPRNCSTVEQLIRLVDSFDRETVCACWDFGHASVAFREEHAAKLKEVGNRIECLHIHDNLTDDDSHQLPFLGAVDWQTCMKTLFAIGYNGTLSFEFAHGDLPASVGGEFFKMLYAIGKTLESYH